MLILEISKMKTKEKDLANKNGMEQSSNQITIDGITNMHEIYIRF